MTLLLAANLWAVTLAGFFGVFLLAIVLAGCSTSRPNWEAIALKCGETLDAVNPALQSCANHLKKDHPGHKLDDDGSLRIRSR